MGNCLKIKDFHQYCDIVMRCPGIGEYLKLIVNKGAFELTTLKPWNSIEHNQKKELQDIDATSTISNTDTIQLGQKECDESTEQIRLLLQQAVPLFQYYIKLFPNDQYARLCQEWFNNGLTEDSTINDLYTTCQLTTLEDLFFLLRLSPALKTYMSFHFEGNKIIYQVHSSLPDLQPSPPTTPSSTLTVASTIQDSKTWVVFHRLIFPLVRSWGSEQQASHIAYAWNSAMDAGLTENSTWEDFQILFDIKNFSDYYYYIANCPVITKNYKIHLDQSTGVISYCSLMGTNLVIPMKGHTMTHESLTDHSVSWLQPVTAIPQSLQLPQHDSASSETPISLDDDSVTDFSIIHSLLYHAVTRWTREPDAKTHPFYSDWLKWKYQGLLPITEWSTVSKILACKDYDEYIMVMQRCPFILNHYDVTWDAQKQELLCHYTAPLDMANYQHLFEQSQGYLQKMQALTHQFEKQTSQMESKIQKIQTHLVYWEHFVDTTLKSGKDRFIMHIIV